MLNYWCDDTFTFSQMTRDEFSVCNAAEGGDAAASVIDNSHPLVQTVMKLGREPFVSPTTSDMSLMYDFPSLKIGPGESSRSHSADEYVCLNEISDAIDLYRRIITGLIT